MMNYLYKYDFTLGKEKEGIMKTKNLSQRLFNVMIIALLLIGCTKGGSQPKSGDWQVQTDFGEFIFTVNNDGTLITKLVITFSNFSCGGIRQNGTISSEQSPGWSISNSKFTIEKSVNPTGSITLTITGTFDKSGEKASGTWKVNVSGTDCSGAWDL